MTPVARAGDCAAVKAAADTSSAKPAPTEAKENCPAAPSTADSNKPSSSILLTVASEVRDVSLLKNGESTEVRVQGDGQFTYRIERLTSPDRLMLTFEGVQLATDTTTIPGNRAPVVSIRMTQFSSSVTRVVIELSVAAAYSVRASNDAVAVDFAPPQQQKKGKKPFAEQQPQPSGATRPKNKKSTDEIQPVNTRWRTYDLEGVPQFSYHLLDPYHQNRLKGDFPMFGQNWFMEWDVFQTAVYKNRRNVDFSKNPRLATDIENKNLKFFAHNNFGDENGIFGFEIRHNDDRFFPSDFRIHIDGAADFKHDINAFDSQSEGHAQVFDAFADFQIHNFGTENFNQMFFRGGLQNFKSDFHGLIFNDGGLGGRVFGQALKNRLRYDVVYIKLFQRDAVSGFFDFSKPAQHGVFITRFTWEDFLVKGWNSEWSFHFNHDPRKIVGNATNQLNLNTYYTGATFNGNVGRFIFNPAIYGVFGTADHLASGVIQPHDVRAWTAVADVEYPLDFWKFRFGYVYASGDSADPKSKTDTGFDSISDAVVLFGGPFSYWTGEDIKFGKGDFTRANSFFPSLRGANGQANYVNPGLQLINAGLDTTITPRLQFAFNENYFRFNNLGTFASGNRPFVINHHAGGIEEVFFLRWKPVLRRINDLFVIDMSFSVLNPLAGLRDAFGSNRPVYTVQLIPRLVF